MQWPDSDVFWVSQKDFETENPLRVQILKVAFVPNTKGNDVVLHLQKPNGYERKMSVWGENLTELKKKYPNPADAIGKFFMLSQALDPTTNKSIRKINFL